MHKLLLVEDNKEIFNMVNNSLSSISHIEWADSIKAANSKLDTSKYELMLLDIDLPDGNGVEFCQSIQNSHPTMPVFFLTAHDQLSEKIMGFSAGADDYITKPFNALELKARVEAKLKKQAILLSNADHLIWKEIEIDKGTQEVFIYTEDDKKELIELTSLEFKILMYFSSQPGQVISRDKVLDSIWGEDVHVYARSVDTHVSKLRKKLADVSHIIESVHGVGYKFKPNQRT